jgi:hypothetical protein
MLQVVATQGRDMTLLEGRIGIQLNDVKLKTDYLSVESQAVKKDIGVFAAIKHLVTDSQLEERTASINTDIKMLTDQTKGFAEHLNGYLARTEAVEKNFQEHVAIAFAKVESEFSEIKSVVEAVHSAGADTGNAVSTASLQFAHTAIQQRTAHVEAEHVAMKMELVDIQQSSAMLAANYYAVIHKMDTAVDAAVQLQAQGPGAPVPCHCHHVTELDGRVAAIEILMAARPMDGPQVLDPWASSRTGGVPTQVQPGNAWNSNAPIREPPGFQRAPANTSAVDNGRRPRVANEHFPELELKDLNRIFDDKVAQDSQFQYNGEKEGEKWEKKVRGYLVSQ